MEASHPGSPANQTDPNFPRPIPRRHRASHGRVPRKDPRKFSRGKVRGKVRGMVEAHTHDRTTPIGAYPGRSGIDMERLTYSVSEVAELLGISRSKAYDLVAAGLLPIVPLPGRRKLVARAVLQRLVDAPERRPEPANGDQHSNGHRQARTTYAAGRRRSRIAS
jgi:excisionase family DNA binding protein